MPFSANITKVRNSNRTKVCTCTCLDNDAPGSVAAYAFAGAIGGMKPMHPTPGPTFAEVTKLTGPNSESEFQIEAFGPFGFTIRKLTAGAAAALVTLSVEIS